MKILITGCAGFIGFHLTNSLSTKYKLVGIDNLNNYHGDRKIKLERISILKKKIKVFKKKYQ